MPYEEITEEEYHSDAIEGPLSLIDQGTGVVREVPDRFCDVHRVEIHTD
jgi:hypothetical protein